MQVPGEGDEELNITDGDDDTDLAVGEDEDRGDEVSPATRDELNELASDGAADDASQSAADDAGAATQEGAQGEGAESEAGAGGEDDAGAGGGDDAGQSQSQMIPKARFDEVNNERRWLREQLAAARGGEAREAQGGDAGSEATQQPAEPFDFDAAERRYQEALMEGDTDAATQIRREINDETVNRARAEAQREARERQQAADVQAAAAAVIQDYPFLDSGSEAKNDDAIAEVVDMRDLYMRRGDTPADALKKAAGRIGPLYAPPAPPARDAGQGAGQTPPDRTAQSKRRNAETANRQPPNLGGTGARGESAEDVNVEDMSDEAFDQLSDAEKSRLRGD